MARSTRSVHGELKAQQGSSRDGMIRRFTAHFMNLHREGYRAGGFVDHDDSILSCIVHLPCLSNSLPETISWWGCAVA